MVAGCYGPVCHMSCVYVCVHACARACVCEYVVVVVGPSGHTVHIDESINCRWDDV